MSLLLLAWVCLPGIFNSGYSQENGTGEAEQTKATENKQLVSPEHIKIIVYARKDAESALSVPVSITAVTEGDMRDADIRKVNDAVSYVPNAVINQFTARAVSNPYFRGIGGSPTNPGVSTFIDGIPQLNSSSSDIEMIDVSQIEFVRGPQGALYGRNTAGGLINITSSSAAERWTTQAHGSLGNYSFRDFRASVASPLLKDRFNFNLAGGYSGRDGYAKNDFTGQDLDKRDALFGKGQLFLKLSDRLKFRWILSGERDRDGDYALGDLGYISSNPHHVNRDFQGYTHRNVNSAIMRVDYQGTTVNFSSITGGVWWENHSLTDLDYQTAVPANGGLYAVRDNQEQQHQFTQEFRVASPQDRTIRLSNNLNLNWQTGIFLFQQNYQQDAVNDISSTFDLFPRIVSESSSDLDDWGVGIYGQAEIVTFKKWHVAVGLRFDHENKSANFGDLRGLSDDLDNGFSEVSPQFSVSYHYNAKHMTYVSASRGYKAGGFNPAPTGVPAPAGTESYGAEHTWNYELGHKSRWLGDRMESTVALFYIDWENLQLNQQIPFSGGQYYIGNAGKANSKGFEFETVYFPSSWCELFGMVGYTHARFLGNSSAFDANLGENRSVAGNALPYTPTFNANAGLQISWAPRHSTRLYLRAQVTVYGDFEYDASNAMGQAEYSLTSFRGGARGMHWFAEGWVENAFDTRYVPIAIPYAQLGAPSGYIGENGAPITFGGRAGFSF